MSEDNLPLYELFTRLRQAGFPLGVSDYNLLLQVLLADTDYPTSSTENFNFFTYDLKNFCQTLWVKSASQRLEFETIYNEIFCTPEDLSRKKKLREHESVKPIPEDDERTRTVAQNLVRERQEFDDGNSVNPQIDEDTNEYFFFPSISSFKPQQSVNVQDDQVVKAVRVGKQERSSFRLSGLQEEYFPVTMQQMEQGWYTLRRPMRDGPRLELDLAATIEQTKRRGKFFHPVQRPRLVKSGQLILLIDHKGSMQPFHVLSRLLVETALQTGCLARSSCCYYFNNYPKSVLYGDPQFQAEFPVDQVMTHLNSTRTIVLIFSDAGAARGNFVVTRIKKTWEFLEKLQLYTKAVAWLNPMPQSYWKDTTAEAISNANIVQMFSADFFGFQNALRVLQ